MLHIHVDLEDLGMLLTCFRDGAEASIREACCSADVPSMRSHSDSQSTVRWKIYDRNMPSGAKNFAFRLSKFAS